MILGDSQLNDEIYSPKFSRKLVNCTTLSALAALVPYRQLNIPDAVLSYNLKLEPSITIPSQLSHSPSKSTGIVYGVSLDQVMGNNGERGLPLPIWHRVEYLRREGMKVEGIFRRSPSSAQLKQIKSLFNQGLF